MGIIVAIVSRHSAAIPAQRSPYDVATSDFFPPNTIRSVHRARVGAFVTRDARAVGVGYNRIRNVIECDPICRTWTCTAEDATPAPLDSCALLPPPPPRVLAGGPARYGGSEN
ncbi:hypothetical protein GW17_00056846 [Ensete ventricosum]|nr:hypothetical protein GW17_00056846 [Ensete ventricosum]